MNKLSDKAIEDIETFAEYIQNNYKKNLKVLIILHYIFSHNVSSKIVVPLQ